MAKAYGFIGYGESRKTAPGKWEDVIIERKFSGDLIRNTRQLREGESLNKGITINNSISVVADAYAVNHFFAIRYVKWSGALWVVEEATVESPRLLLRLGGVYNGPTSDSSPAV